MRRLVLVRHGESIWNAETRIQGQRCAGLSSAGRAQAAALAAGLAATHPDARLATSDLTRCRETVAPLERLLGRDAVADERLRERSFGDWEGRLRDDVAAEEPDRWRRWRAGEDVVAEAGGESARQLLARVAPVFEALLAATPVGGVTVAVTHGGPVWHGTHHLLGLPPRTLGGVGNASVTELAAWDDGPLTLERWNEIAHLPVDLRTAWRPPTRSRAPVAGH